MHSGKYHILYAKETLKTGYFYWQLKLEDFSILENVTVGVALSGI